MPLSARLIDIPVASGPFSLAATCAPVAWGGGRWPNVDWIDGSLVWVGWETGCVVWRRVTAVGEGGLVAVTGSASAAEDERWLARVLGWGSRCPRFQDEVVEIIRDRLPGLRPFAYGSLFDGLVSSIVGQSISIASAAVTERRLAALFHPGVMVAGRRFWPLPRVDDLAAAVPALVRESGVTWRRADALVAAAQVARDGGIPEREQALVDPDQARAALRRLPLVGPWTTESTLLWGIGLGDAYPTKDIALLRAARLAYSAPELSATELDVLANGWRPARGWAARLLWTALLGPAPAGSAAGCGEVEALA